MSRKAMIQRLANIIEMAKLKRRAGETPLAALRRTLKSKTDTELRRMLEELESGEPG